MPPIQNGSSSPATLTPDLVREIQNALDPHIRDEDARSTVLLRAFGSGSPILDGVDLKGSPINFSARLIRILWEYGTIEGASESALAILLRSVANYTGIENAATLRRLADEVARGVNHVPQTTENLPNSTLPEPNPNAPLVYLCHAEADKVFTRVLYRRLVADGFYPWIDEVEILPAQDDEIEMREAIDRSERFVACVSKNVIRDRRWREQVRSAVKIEQGRGLEWGFVLPVGWDDSKPPYLKKGKVTPLFPCDGSQINEEGYRNLLKALKRPLKKGGGAVLTISPPIPPSATLATKAIPTTPPLIPPPTVTAGKSIHKKENLEGITFDEAQARRDEVKTLLLQRIPGAQSVGIIRLEDGKYGFQVVSNSNIPLERGDFTGETVFEMEGLERIPLTLKQLRGRVKASTVSGTQSAFDAGSSAHPDTASDTFLSGGSLLCGAEIQNYDSDLREDTVAVGTLGCFVRCSDGTVALLSTNHDIASENEARPQVDRILSPMATRESTALEIAARLVGTLHTFEPLILTDKAQLFSGIATGTLQPNVIDAAIARLTDQIVSARRFRQQFPLINGRSLPSPRATLPMTEDLFDRKVFKLGRTTGYTEGTIATLLTDTTIEYSRKQFGYFEGVFEVESTEQYPRFCKRGDSGSVVMDFDGNVLGLLFASTSDGTGYVCPIETILHRLNCTLYTE